MENPSLPMLTASLQFSSWCCQLELSAERFGLASGFYGSTGIIHCIAGRWAALIPARFIAKLMSRWMT